MVLHETAACRDVLFCFPSCVLFFVSTFQVEAELDAEAKAFEEEQRNNPEEEDDHDTRKLPKPDRMRLVVKNKEASSKLSSNAFSQSRLELSKLVHGAHDGYESACATRLLMLVLWRCFRVKPLFDLPPPFSSSGTVGMVLHHRKCFTHTLVLVSPLKSHESHVNNCSCFGYRLPYIHLWCLAMSLPSDQFRLQSRETVPSLDA